MPEPKLFDTNCVDDGVLANFEFKGISNEARRFIIGRMWYRVRQWAIGPNYDTQANDIVQDNCPHSADLYSSEDVGNPRLHRLVLDIDVPAYLIPSSTPGHSHLLIDRAMDWPTYVKVMDALVEAGIVEAGYVAASKRRGCTVVRLPWRKKNKARSAGYTW